MTTLHSLESKIVWGALTMFAVTTAACGGATQSMTGTAPSSFAATSAAPDAGGTFGLLKEGKGKRPADDQEGDDSEHGHGHTALELEGFTSSITGTCPDLTIVINEQTITTNKDTDFQRVNCADLTPVITTPTTGTTPPVGTKSETTPTTTAPEPPSFHLHIAATMGTEGKLVATYVRMQGPKVADGEDDEDEGTATTTK